MAKYEKRLRPQHMRYAINIYSVVDLGLTLGQESGKNFIDITGRIALIGIIRTWFLTFAKCSTLSETRKICGDHLIEQH